MKFMTEVGASEATEKNIPWYLRVSGLLKLARYSVRMLFHSSGVIFMSTPTALKLAWSSSIIGWGHMFPEPPVG
mgnify:CR=1 FL=1